MVRTKFWGRVFSILAILAAALATPVAAAPLSVVASIYPVADMVHQVGGDLVAVTTLIPPGASPHTFEPKPSEVRRLVSARLIFFIGAGLELWADKFVRATGTTARIVVLSRGVNLLQAAPDSDGRLSGGAPTASGQAALVANPHIWLDPVIAGRMVGKIATALCEVDAAHADIYRRRAAAYAEALKALDARIRRTVAAFAIRKFISFHPAWDYFARRYGLKSSGTIEETPGRVPTPRHIEDIVTQIKRSGIRAVFAEPQLNPKVAEVVAREAGVKVVFLDPIGGPGLPGRDTYIHLMQTNVKRMREAMQ